MGLFCLHCRCRNRGTEQQERHCFYEGIAGLHRNGSGVTEEELRGDFYDCIGCEKDEGRANWRFSAKIAGRNPPEVPNA